MQFLDYLDLKQQNITEFLAESGWADGLTSDQIEVLRVKVWRHAHAKRRPSPEDIDRYDEATKGAVRLEDWHELALRSRDPPEPAVASG